MYFLCLSLFLLIGVKTNDSPMSFSFPSNPLLYHPIAIDQIYPSPNHKRDFSLDEYPQSGLIHLRSLPKFTDVDVAKPVVALDSATFVKTSLTQPLKENLSSERGSVVRLIPQGDDDHLEDKSKITKTKDPLMNRFMHKLIKFTQMINPKDEEKDADEVNDSEEITQSHPVKSNPSATFVFPRRRRLTTQNKL